MEFKAVVIGKEINLNRLASHFGVARKYKWDEAFVLSGSSLEGLVGAGEGKGVYIFHFGALVFVNSRHHDIMDVIHYLRRIDPAIGAGDPFRYTDDYRLELDPDAEETVSNDVLAVQAPADYHGEIIATVLAKSVALEKSEADMETLLDEAETVVHALNEGDLSLSDDRLARLSGRILGFKYNTISYIMLLDKPDITWVNENAGALFDHLSILFELSERYEILLRKTEVLSDTTAVFSGLAHARRGNRLEWAVIILIAIEIVLSLYEMFFRH